MVSRNAAVVDVAGRSFQRHSAWILGWEIRLARLMGFPNRAQALVGRAWNGLGLEPALRLMLPYVQRCQEMRRVDRALLGEPPTFVPERSPG